MSGMTPERLAKLRRVVEAHYYFTNEESLDLLDHIDHLTAEVDRLRGIEAGIEALHRPVLAVFSWKTGLRFEEPCPECHGKAGVHSCGCWADEGTTYECAECAIPKGGGSRRVIPWPCPTAALLSPTEQAGGAS